MTRAISGISLIVLTMVLSAWVALNEPTRIQIYDAQFTGRKIENGAQNFEQYCVSCHGDKGQGVPGKGPELFPRLFTEREPQLKAEKLGLTLNKFVELTVSGGRPVWSEQFGGGQFPEHMPTWSNRYGGPLRDDQIDDIVNYIMNWEGAVGQVPSGQPAAESAYPPSQPLPPGNATDGEALFRGEKPSGVTGNNLPCSACHSLAQGETKVGPSLAGIGTTAEQRLKENYQGKATDAGGYIHESIVQPNAHIAGNDPQFTQNDKSKMPEGLANQLTPQDLADLIAFLLSLK